MSLSLIPLDPSLGGSFNPALNSSSYSPLQTNAILNPDHFRTQYNPVMRSHKYSDLTRSSERGKREGKLLLQNVEKALQEGGEFKWSPASSYNGIYMITDKTGEVIANFKPQAERLWGTDNRNPHFRREELSSEEMIKEDVWKQGLSSQREVLANQFDLGNHARIPQGTIATLESDLFFDQGLGKDQSSEKKQRKLGYLQAWIPNSKPLWKMAGRYPEYDLSSYSILNNVPLNEFQKIGILDFVIFNTDRHSGNILITTDKKGIPHLIPIDHDYALPCNLKYFYGGVFTHPVAEKPFTEETRQLITELDPAKMGELVMRGGLPEQAARNAQALAMILKTFAKNPLFTLADLYRFAHTTSEVEGISSIALLLSEVNLKALAGFDEGDLESIKLRSWTSPSTITPEDLGKLNAFNKVFWSEFQKTIDLAFTNISLNKIEI